MATRRPPVRASDEERERATRALARHHVAGRLDVEELEQRLERAQLAVTRQELRALQRDLPAARRRRGWLAWADHADRVARRAHVAAYAGANGIAIGVWDLTGGGAFWPAWLLLPSTAALAVHLGTSYTFRRAFTPPARGRRRARDG